MKQVDVNQAGAWQRDAAMRRALYRLAWERVEAGKANPRPCLEFDDETLLAEWRRILGGGGMSITERLTNLTMYVLAGSVAAVVLAGVVRLVGLILGL